MITRTNLKKRNYGIKLILNTQNNSLTEIKYKTDASKDMQVSCSYYTSKGKSFNTYITRISYLYDWGYQ